MCTTEPAEEGTENAPAKEEVNGADEKGNEDEKEEEEGDENAATTDAAKKKKKKNKNKNKKYVKQSLLIFWDF